MGKPALAGAVARWLKCPEHGRYLAGVLFIGVREFPGRCPQCRLDDDRVDTARLRNDAIYLLGNLGRASMAIHRKRRANDREYFVRLVDDKDSSKVAVGNFWAESETEAIRMAEREFPGLFNALETRTWKARAEPTGQKVA